MMRQGLAAAYTSQTDHINSVTFQQSFLSCIVPCTAVYMSDTVVRLTNPVLEYTVEIIYLASCAAVMSSIILSERFSQHSCPDLLLVLIKDNTCSVGGRYIY